MIYCVIPPELEDELYDRLVEHYETLAYHYSQSDERVRAIEYLTKAGEKATAAYANREAFEFYERALALVGESDVPRQAQLAQEASTVGFWAGLPDRALPFGETALRLFETLGDKVNVVRMHRSMAALYISGAWDGAREDHAIRHVEASAELVEHDPDDVEKGLTYQRGAHRAPEQNLLPFHEAGWSGTVLRRARPRPAGHDDDSQRVAIARDPPGGVVRRHGVLDHPRRPCGRRRRHPSIQEHAPASAKDAAHRHPTAIVLLGATQDVADRDQRIAGGRDA